MSAVGLADAVRRAGNVVLGYYFRLQTDRLPGGPSRFLPRVEPGAPHETLAQRLKAEVVGASVLIELVALAGRSALKGLRLESVLAL